jgi:hypothetical protein
MMATVATTEAMTRAMTLAAMETRITSPSEYASDPAVSTTAVETRGFPDLPRGRGGFIGQNPPSNARGPRQETFYVGTFFTVVRLVRRRLSRHILILSISVTASQLAAEALPLFVT